MPLVFQVETKRGSSVTADDLPALAVWSYGYSSCNFRLVTFSKNHPAFRAEGGGNRIGMGEKKRKFRTEVKLGFSSFRQPLALNRQQPVSALTGDQK